MYPMTFLVLLGFTVLAGAWAYPTTITLWSWVHTAPLANIDEVSRRKW